MLTKNQQLYRPLFSPWLSPGEFRRYYEQAAPRTLVSPDRCYVLYSLLKQAIHITGNVWECGVYKGGTAAMMAAILRDKQPTKKLYLFDTFAGMPETDPTKDLHKQGDFADTSVEAVAQYLRCDARCYIRKGLIPHTFAGLEDERIAFIHIDLDIYQAIPTVRRIETAYDTQGNAYLLTSYDAATSGSIVNQIQREFDGLGQMTTEWQAVGGAVNTSTSPKVQYAYSFAPSGSTNHSRLTSITYPNGRVISYNYASGLNADISRLSSISDGGTTLESYEYLGYGTVVKRGHAQPAVDLTYIKLSGESDGDAGDKYIGLDRFGRIADNRWRSSSADLERRQYGYDRDSNRLYAENMVDSTRSELYAYDGFNQLTSAQRGILNGTKTGLVGVALHSQSWDYDGLGNWDSVTTDLIPQTRSHNKQNEITSILLATTPTYDANGNLLTDEAAKQFVYDAYNRLAIVKSSGGSTLATYKYDATGRRVRETRSGTTTDLYYTSQWQVIEERVGGNVKLSYVWSPVYVDAMIARDRDSDSNGSLEERLYAIHDANFNVVALLDTSGAVVERFAYDAFGVFSVLTPGWGARGSSNYAWNYLYQELRLDPDSGLLHARNRDYSPTVGRWAQLDPIGFNGRDENTYAFVHNNPLGDTDPLGLAAYSDVYLGNESITMSTVNGRQFTSILSREEVTFNVTNEVRRPVGAATNRRVITTVGRNGTGMTGSGLVDSVRTFVSLDNRSHGSMMMNEESPGRGPTLIHGGISLFVSGLLSGTYTFKIDWEIALRAEGEIVSNDDQGSQANARIFFYNNGVSVYGDGVSLRNAPPVGINKSGSTLIQIKSVINNNYDCLKFYKLAEFEPSIILGDREGSHVVAMGFIKLASYWRT